MRWKKLTSGENLKTPVLQQHISKGWFSKHSTDDLANWIFTIYFCQRTPKISGFVKHGSPLVLDFLPKKANRKNNTHSNNVTRVTPKAPASKSVLDKYSIVFVNNALRHTIIEQAYFCLWDFYLIVYLSLLFLSYFILLLLFYSIVFFLICGVKFLQMIWNVMLPLTCNVASTQKQNAWYSLIGEISPLTQPGPDSGQGWSWRAELQFALPPPHLYSPPQSAAISEDL